MARMSKNDWLEAGLQVVIERGHEALTIDDLCQRLKVTKGSFYHHFRAQDDFHEALLAHWEQHYTAAFIEYSQQGTTPVERLRRLQTIVVSTYGTQENAVRAWAQRDVRARAVQERVDQRRLDYLTALQVALHNDAQRARTTALLLYSILIGAAAIYPPATRDELQAMYDYISQRSAIASTDSSMTITS